MTSPIRATPARRDEGVVVAVPVDRFLTGAALNKDRLLSGAIVSEDRFLTGAALKSGSRACSERSAIGGS
jgi:hypothetical protein